MSIELPGGLAEVFSLLSGQKWPEGDEDKMFAMGDGLIGVGQQFGEVSGHFGSAAGAVLSHVGGAPANQFYDFAAQLHGNLPSMSQAAVDLGTMSRSMAAQVEYAKYMIIATLVWLAYEIAQWAAFLPEAVPMFIEAADLAVGAILRRLLTAAVIGGVSMAGMDLAVQGIQKLKGDRSSINWISTLGMAEAGALGGALGGAVFTLGSKAIGAVAKSALSDTTVVKKLVNSVPDPQQRNDVTSSLSTSDKVSLGVVSTVEKVGLGAVTGVTTGGTMTATFGGPDEVGLSMASGAAGMLTGERHGSGTDGGGDEPPLPYVDLPGVDDAAAKLTLLPSAPESLGATGTAGVMDTASSASVAPATETSTPTSVSTSEAGGLPGFSTTLVADTPRPDGGVAGGVDGGGVATRGTGGSGGLAELGAGAAGGDTAATATGAVTGNPGGFAGGTTAASGERGGVVTESAGTRARFGAGATTTGHSTAGEPATSGRVSPSGAGAGRVPGPVATDGVPSVLSTARSGFAGTEAGGVHTGSTEPTQAIGTPTESSGPVRGVSGDGGPAATGVTPESATGVTPANPPGDATVHPPARTGSGGTEMSRPVTESPAPAAALPRSAAPTNHGPAPTDPTDRDPQVGSPTSRTAPATYVTDPAEHGQQAPAPASAGTDPRGGHLAATSSGTGARGPSTSGLVEPVVTGGSRAGLPGLEAHLVSKPVTGHDGTTGQRAPAPQAGRDTCITASRTRDTATADGSSPDLVGQAPHERSVELDSSDPTAGQPGDTATAIGSGAESDTRHDDRVIDDAIAKEPTAIRTTNSASQPPERAWSEVNESRTSGVKSQPNQHVAEHSGDAEPHIAAPPRVQDLSGDFTRSDDLSQILQPAGIRLSDLVPDVNREIMELTRKTGDIEYYLPSAADIVRIYYGLDEWNKEGTARNIGERIAQIHVARREAKLLGGADYRLVHPEDKGNVVESGPSEVPWRAALPDPGASPAATGRPSGTPVNQRSAPKRSATQTHLDLPFHNHELKEQGRNRADAHVRFLRPTEPAEEGQLDGWVRRKITPEQAEHFERIQQAVIEKEDEHGADYYPFYHAQDPRIRVAQDIYKRVYARHYGEEVPDDFHFLRYPGPADTDYSQYANIAQFFEADMKQHGLIDDNIVPTKSNIISANLSLHGGLNHLGEETFFYFQDGKGQRGINVPWFIENFLPKFGLDASGVAEMYKEAEELTDTTEGSLFQILVPRHLADEVAYLAHPHGLPHDDELLDDLHTLSPILYNVPTSPSIGEEDSTRPMLPASHERERMNDEIARNLDAVRDVWSRHVEEPSPVPGRSIIPPGPHITAEQAKAVRAQLAARAEQRRQWRVKDQAVELHRRTLERFRQGDYAPTRHLDDYVAHPERLSHPDLAWQRTLVERNPEHFQGQGKRSSHEMMRVANRQTFIQARVLLSANHMLNPRSGIKIVRHTTMNEENAKAYDLLLDSYVEKVFTNRETNQQAPGGREG
jgi:hypothetical protein